MNYRDHTLRYAAEREWEHVTASMTLGITKVTVDEFRKGKKVIVATFMDVEPLKENWSDYWTLGHYDFGDGRRDRIEAVQSRPGQSRLSLEQALDEPS